MAASIRKRGSKHNQPPTWSLSGFSGNFAKPPPSHWCPCSSRDITLRIFGEHCPLPPPTAPFWGDFHNKALASILANGCGYACLVLAHTHITHKTHWLNGPVAGKRATCFEGIATEGGPPAEACTRIGGVNNYTYVGLRVKRKKK